MPRVRNTSIAADILAIRSSLSDIVDALQRLAPRLEQLTGAATTTTAAAATRTPKIALSAERRAALKLQGQYMGYIRSLKPREKSRVRALRASNGIRAAISLARKLATA